VQAASTPVLVSSAVSSRDDVLFLKADLSAGAERSLRSANDTAANITDVDVIAANGTMSHPIPMASISTLSPSVISSAATTTMFQKEMNSVHDTSELSEQAVTTTTKAVLLTREVETEPPPATIAAKAPAGKTAAAMPTSRAGVTTTVALPKTHVAGSSTSVFPQKGKVPKTSAQVGKSSKPQKEAASAAPSISEATAGGSSISAILFALLGSVGLGLLIAGAFGLHRRARSQTVHQHVALPQEVASVPPEVVGASDKRSAPENELEILIESICNDREEDSQSEFDSHMRINSAAHAFESIVNQESGAPESPHKLDVSPLGDNTELWSRAREIDSPTAAAASEEMTLLTSTASDWPAESEGIRDVGVLPVSIAADAGFEWPGTQDPAFPETSWHEAPASGLDLGCLGGAPAPQQSPEQRLDQDCQTNSESINLLDL